MAKRPVHADQPRAKDIHQRLGTAKEEIERLERERDQREAIYRARLKEAWEERDEARQWARYFKSILVIAEQEEERPEGLPQWLEIKGYDSGCGD
jgi:hypothetical protein